jgi:hypothetical protein
MKKILLLLPIIGICSSLFAQAPQVLHVSASQVDGTKDVQIDFEITNKIDYSGELNVEVWYRTSPDQTQWERAMSLWESSEIGLSTNDEFLAGPDGEEMVIYSHRIPAGGDTPTARAIYWKAGDDAHDVKTDQAQVRVVVFYQKLDESGGILPASGQVSGWDGFDDGSTGGDTGGDTGAGGDGSVNDGIPVYDLSAEQISSLTDFAVAVAGLYTIEGYIDEDETSLTYQQFVGIATPVFEVTFGDWNKDGEPIQLSSTFATMADIDNYLATQALTPIGHIAPEETLF